MNRWYDGFLGQWAATSGMGWLAAIGGLTLIITVIWSLFWKGMALWKAAREGSRGSKIWFVVLLVVNTLGILEILYIYVFSKKSKSSSV